MLVLVLFRLHLRNQEKLLLRYPEVRYTKIETANTKIETANTKTDSVEIKPDCHQPPLPQRHISYTVCAEMLIVLLALIPLHAN